MRAPARQGASDAANSWPRLGTPVIGFGFDNAALMSKHRRYSIGVGLWWVLVGHFLQARVTHDLLPQGAAEAAAAQHNRRTLPPLVLLLLRHEGQMRTIAAAASLARRA